jgi:hypothetical protein
MSDMNGIAFNLIALAAEESREHAIEAAELLQAALESLIEIGTPAEVQSAKFLLKNVNLALKEILEGTLVNVYSDWHLERSAPKH